MARRANKKPIAASNLIEALDNPALFGGMGFEKPSWARWRVFLTALFGLPMTPEQLEIFRHHTARNEAPKKPSRYASLIVGRRGGKTRTLALISVYLACCVDHRQYLVPGERAVIACIAKDRQQAKVLLGYISGFLKEITTFSGLIEADQVESLHLSNGVSIEVHTASIGAPRGRTFLAVLCDENAFWQNGEGANPDHEVITAVRPGLSTIPYSILLLASSPYARRGVLYSNYAKYFGKDDAPVLVWKGTTQEMNSNLVDDELIDEMLAEDNERAMAEYFAEFRSDITEFISREAVEAVLAHGIRELPPGNGLVYRAFTDPSGGSADSFTIAIGHVEENGVAVLDVLRETRPPFSPDAVVEEYARLLKLYSISRVQGDAYAGLWPRERFSVHGIQYDVSDKNKSQIYLEFLPALNGRRVQLLDIPRLTGQFIGLERRTARGGRDSVDHAPGGNDDSSNAVAGLLVSLIADRRPALVKPADMAAPSHLTPYAPPLKASYVLALIVIGESGIGATVYAAQDAASSALFICDFTVAPMSGDTFAGIAARMDRLRQECRTSESAIFCDESLLLFARSAGARAEAIPADFRAEERLLSVAGHVASGNVRITGAVVEKARSSPFAGALDLRAGEGVEDPIRAALVSLIALALDDTRMAA